MSKPFGTTTDIGTGTLTTSTGAATAAVTPNANTQPGDMIIAVCYMAGDPAGCADAGDGWLFLDQVYNATNGFGLFMAICVAVLGGSSGYAGIRLPSSMAYTLQNYTFALVGAGGALRYPGVKWDLANARGSQGGLTATASAQALPAPAMNGIIGESMMGVDLLGRGYNNGGTVRTVAAPSSHAERFDTGQASPPHGVVMNRLWWPSYTANAKVQITSNISVACVNRAGLRCFVPITGISYDGMGRYMQYRRYR